MNLTKNEKILLILLFTVIIFLGIYKIIITPQISKIENLTQERYEYKEKISEMNNILKGESEVLKEWNDLHNEKDLIANKYFSNLDQSEIIYFLNDIFDNNDIEILDINFNKPFEEEVGCSLVKTMDISIPYRASYEDLLETMKNVDLSSKKIIMTDITIDKDGEYLVGNMILKVYSIEGLSNSQEEEFSTLPLEENKKETPFEPYSGYSKQKLDLETTLDLENSQEVISDLRYDFVSKKTNNKLQKPIGKINSKARISNNVSSYITEILLDFEDTNNYFLPSHSLIKGSLGQSTNSKSKKYSLRFEYNITASEKENRAYIDVSQNNIGFKYPPNSMGIWIYSYNYSPANFGIQLSGEKGEKIELLLVEEISWTGWRYIGITLPNDLLIYPLKLNSLYLELPEGRDDYGVILLDKLEVVYNRNPDESGKSNNGSDYVFHVVEKNESIENISLKYYGTEKYKDEILKLNEMKTSEKLFIDKVLVLNNP